MTRSAYGANKVLQTEKMIRNYQFYYPRLAYIIQGRYKYINTMHIHKQLLLDQNSTQMVQLADKNGTTYGICGFITCALTRHLAMKSNFQPSYLKSINKVNLEAQIDVVMKLVLQRRRFDLKKYYKIMSDDDRKKYLRDWMANYQIADYLENTYDQFINKQVYFFRQSAYDHPEALALIKLEEKARVEEELPFKGELFFYSSFGPYENHFKEEFQKVIRNSDKSKPIIIATDILGHFYTTVLFEGQIYILDSLSSYMDTKSDSKIVECIEYLYKQSYLIHD